MNLETSGSEPSAQRFFFADLAITARQGLRGASSAETEAQTSNSQGVEVNFQVGDRVRRHNDPPNWQPYTLETVNATTGTATLIHPEFMVPAPVPITELYRADVFRRRQRSLLRLHELLIAPIADLLPSNPEERIIFIPHEQLFLVPFPALQNVDGQYLIERHTVLFAPAIEVLGLPKNARSKFAGLHHGLPRKLLLGILLRCLDRLHPYPMPKLKLRRLLKSFTRQPLRKLTPRKHGLSNA